MGLAPCFLFLFSKQWTKVSTYHRIRDGYVSIRCIGICLLAGKISAMSCRLFRKDHIPFQ